MTQRQRRAKILAAMEMRPDSVRGFNGQVPGHLLAISRWSAWLFGVCARICCLIQPDKPATFQAFKRSTAF